MKRALSLVLAFVLVLGMMPVQVFSADETGAEPTVDTGSITIEGTDSFGELLSEELQESRQEAAEGASAYEAGYSVTGLVIEDGVATVTYDTLEDAYVIVALYSEDGLQMLNSAQSKVTPDETTAYVTFEGEMPDYFLASAYLLDTYDLSPLCTAYGTPMYTRQMQELLASTTDDYDPDRVLNLDEDETTNFAVYAEGVTQLESSDTVNTVVSADDESKVYVIENADESITTLTEGSIFVLPYGADHLLIAKVASIRVDGTTVTITGSDLEMEEVFQIMKIESNGTTADVVVDDSTADEGISYVGLKENDGPSAYAWEDSGTATESLEYSIDVKAEASGGDLSASMEVKGSLLLEVESTVNYYISFDQQFIEFRVTPKATLDVRVDGNVSLNHSCGKMGITPVPGVFVGLSPELKMEFTGEAEVKITIQATMGVGYDTRTGIQNLSTAPEKDVYLSVEGTIFFGIDFHPNVTVLEVVAKLELETLVGLEIQAVMKGSLFEDAPKNAESYHTCRACLSMELSFKADVNGNLTFLEQDWLSFPVEIGEFSLPLGSMYLSFDNDEFDIGECPNYTYRVIVEVLDKNQVPISGHDVVVSTLDDPVVTNAYGVAVFYAPATTIQIFSEHEGYFDSAEETIDGATKIRLVLENLSSGDGITKDDWIFGTVDSEEILDQSAILASGQAGDNIYWTLSKDGKMVFQGSGAMWHWNYENGVYPEWEEYKHQIGYVEIQNGITSIGLYAFRYCPNLKDVSIPGSVSIIWKGAFDSCSSLTHVAFPYGVKEIGQSSFYGCSSLTSITVPVTVTEISYYAFYWGPALKDIYYSGTQDQWNQIQFRNNYYYGGFADAHVHYNATESCSYVQTAYVGANCGADGYIEYTCTGCGDSYTKTIASTGDCNYVESARVEAGCGTDGYIEYTCTGCGNSYEEAILASGECSYVETDRNDGEGWIEYTCTVCGNTYLYEFVALASDAPALFSIHGGSYETETNDTYTLKTASFTGLIPGKDYVLLALSSMDAEDLIGPDNLLYIDQAAALEDGTLVFRYIQRVDTDISYVMVCGPSDKDLSDATITFPDMTADGEVQAVNPTVVYDGKTLTEGKDYTIVGTVSFTKAGTYTCYLRGIRDYTGFVACNYSVTKGVCDHIYENGTCTICGNHIGPVIVQQPVNGEAKLGDRYCVTVNAEGEDLTYQWYLRNAGSKSFSKSSVKDNTYDDVMTKTRAGREIYCVITDKDGNSVTTDTVKLVLLPAEELEIVTQPTDGEAALGDRYCVTVEAKGDGLKYQWYFRSKGAGKWTKSTVRDNTYDDIMTKARMGREIYCVITDAWGNSVESDHAFLVGVPSETLAIVTQPTTQEVSMDEGFCATVEAVGDELKYQWYFRNRGSEQWYTSGQRDNTYDDSMTKARMGREIYCVITDIWGNRVETEHVFLNAVPKVPLAITGQPTDVSVPKGDRFCVTVEAQGEGLRYTWYFKNKGSNVWNRSGVTDNTYDDILTTARTDRQVYCVITDQYGNSVTSEVATIRRTQAS